MPFSQPHADKALKFIGHLKHTKGQWHGVPFDMHDWQKKIISDLFGTLDKKGNRQYRTAYIELPRKNGKSELAAAIALKLLFADGEAAAEIYSAAADRDQASLVFNAAAAMVRQSPTLMERCQIINSQKRIVVEKTGSFYRAISAESATKHGYSAHGIIFDELHTQANRDLWDVLTTSQGCRHQPLVVAITTAGYDRNSICWEQHDYARRILDKAVDDPTFYPVVYAASEEDDWTDEAVWKRANPALGVFRSLEEMQASAKKALEIPALENTFRRLYLNQWTKQESRFIPMHTWDDLDTPVDPEALVGCRCYAGLDLASTTDIAAFVLVFPMDDGSYQVIPHFWIPDENMHERARKDRVPYDLWCRSGLITATPGNVIDYKFIFDTISKAAVKYDLVEVAFDRWGATKIIQELQDRDMTVIDFGQGFASMSPPTKELLNLILSGKLAHGGNPVLRWMADNMVVRQDPAGNLKPDKGKSTEKIDGLVALIMGLDRALKHGDTHKSVYETRGVIAF